VGTFSKLLKNMLIAVGDASDVNFVPSELYFSQYMSNELVILNHEFLVF